jgi:hypothetical protein
MSRRSYKKELGKSLSKNNFRDHEEQKNHQFGWNSDAHNDFSSKTSSISKATHNLSSINMSRSSNARNSIQFSQNQAHTTYSTTQAGKNMTSSQISESHNEEGFKGNIYFMKFEHFLKEFNNIYMLKIYQKDEVKEDEESEDFNLESGRFKKKRNPWKCYVFGSYWKGKRLGGPKVDLEKMYISNQKSRFKKGIS